MKVIRVAHIAVAAEQLDAMKAVFGDLLQMPLLRARRFESGTEMAMYEAGNLHVEVLHNPSPASLPGRHVHERNGSSFFHICLEVDDFDAAINELTARGVKLHLDSPRKGESGGKVVFLDPATTGGLLIELAQADDIHAH
ncbi:MAG: VOC family protein [Burkholderiaceae bacterium]